MSRYHVQISARFLSWPQVCACCEANAEELLDAAASKSRGRRVVTTVTRSWKIPHCSRCSEHIRSHQMAREIFQVGSVLSLIIGLTCLWMGLGWPLAIGWTVFVLITAGVGSWGLRREARHNLKPTCAAVGPAVEYCEWYGTMHDFVFSNAAYLAAFLALNDRKSRSDVTVQP